jgi:hypothetical protein
MNKNIKISTRYIKEGIIQHSTFNIRHFLILFICICLSTSCVKYSLSGGDTGAAKTISIQNFFNEAGGGPPNLGQLFTEKLKDYYQRNTKMSLVASNGDWQFDGRIISYVVTPIAPRENETSGLNRLTIRVKVNFVNTKEGTNEVESFESDFSFYADFPQSQSLSQVESQLIEDILNQIVFDVFSKTTSNW